MNIRHGVSLSLACLGMGFKQAAHERMVMFGSFLTYATIMLLYAGVIHMIPAADLAKFAFGQKEMIWYLGTAEFILFATPSWYFREFQNEIQNGDIHLTTLRPVSSALVKLAIWAGEALGRVCVLFGPYLLLITALSGGFCFTPIHLLGFIASLPLAILINVCAWYFVGASCLWVAQADPVAWVYQKAIFLFGAMLWPLSFYPFWLQVFSWATPFPSILAIGARWTLASPPSLYGLAFAHQIFWAVFFVLATHWFEGKIMRHIQETGA